MNNETTLDKQNKHSFSLGSDAIKYFAVFAMLIDHIGWCFADSFSVLGYVMHTLGRMTAPIMTYFLVEGFHYTRNLNKYLLRLAAFAALSWIPFVFMEFGVLPISFDEGNLFFNPLQGVIYTFFLTLLALKAVHSENMKKSVRFLAVFGLCILAILGDWMFIPIIWALVFDKYRGNFKKQAIAFAISSVVIVTVVFVLGQEQVMWFQYGVLLAIIPLYFYNGEKGRGGKFNKWFFYVFYPVHMLVLGILKWIILE